MNEERLLAARLTGALDETADKLPYRVTERLARARALALERAAAGAVAMETTPLPAGNVATLRRTGEDGSRPRWLRAGAWALPALVLAAGLYSIGLWVDAEDASEIADVDAAVLTDDVPIDTYLDRGFGVFLKNDTAP